VHTKLLCEAIEFRAVLKQGASVALPLEEIWLLTNGAQERRLARGDQAAVADVLVSHSHKRTGLDIALGVDVER
jgi:hypothetical protein